MHRYGGRPCIHKLRIDCGRFDFERTHGVFFFVTVELTLVAPQPNAIAMGSGD